MHGVDTPIDYLELTSVPLPAGDVKELGAIREVFGDKCSAISATKSDDRHCWVRLAQEAIYSADAGARFIAPSINIEELDEQAAVCSS